MQYNILSHKQALLQCRNIAGLWLNCGFYSANSYLSYDYCEHHTLRCRVMCGSVVLDFSYLALLQCCILIGVVFYSAGTVLSGQKGNKVMPRQNVYLKQKTIDGIRQIVDMRREEGATTSDANISSVCSEMLELGMRVYLNARNRKVSDAEAGEDVFQTALFEEVVKSRMASQEILALIFSLQDIKSDSRNNYDKLIDTLKEKTDTRVRMVLSRE